MKINYDTFIALLKGLEARFNKASETENHADMLMATMALRELFTMEAKNIHEQACQKLHGIVMAELLDPPQVIVTPAMPSKLIS